MASIVSGWSVESCTRSSSPTDAFGEIEFAGKAASESNARVGLYLYYLRIVRQRLGLCCPNPYLSTPI